MPRTVKKDANLQKGMPVKPTTLSKRASGQWDRLVGELTRARIQLTEAHRAVLTLAATIAADIAASWESIEKDGAYQLNKKTGVMQEHPAAKRMDALRRDYMKALTMLGLRAMVAEPEQGKGPTLADILNGAA
jgi:P27 family predicted phage terminase small subunit